MSGIEHISSPYSENWVYWVFLLLLALMFLNHSIKNSMIVAFRTISSHSDRVYGGQNSNILGVLTAWVFRIALFALVMYMVSFDGGDFTFWRYLIILVGVGAVCLVQYILTLGIGWVFVARKDLDNGLGQIEIVRNCIGVMLLPMPLWMIVVDNSLLSLRVSMYERSRFTIVIFLLTTCSGSAVIPLYSTLSAIKIPPFLRSRTQSFNICI